MLIASIRPLASGSGGGLAGDCHFDEGESWSVNRPATGTDLATVALHELGHGLGLDHSDVTTAVMYAYYEGERRELTDDDISGIQSIYGVRVLPHVIELFIDQADNKWKAFNLTEYTKAPPAAGDPHGYLADVPRADYRTSPA